VKPDYRTSSEIVEQSSHHEPSKPTEPGFVGFEGAVRRIPPQIAPTAQEIWAVKTVGQCLRV